jgi:hypothetical protein
MSNVATVPLRVNGILETFLYVESPARSAEFCRRADLLRRRGAGGRAWPDDACRIECL